MNKTIYNILCNFRNKKSLNIVNKIAKIDDYNLIVPNLYLGNINCASNTDFLIKHNIQAIVNCTENEPFHEYFDSKEKFRISVNDSKNDENIASFKKQIIDGIIFIDKNIEGGNAIFVHCYWGLMRSATVVASYLIKKYGLTANEAIHLIKTQRPYALLSFYNFDEILKFVEETNLT